MIRNTPKKQGDFFEIENTGVIAISETALTKSSSFFNKDKNIELLPIYTDSGNYFILNILNIIDCLNKTSSKFQALKSGIIIEYSYIELHLEKVEDLAFFKIPELPFINLISNNALIHYRNKSLKGLEFDEDINLL